MISGLFQEHVPRSPPSPWRPSAGACCLATSPACSSARTTRATSARSNSVINTHFWSNASLYSRRGLVLHSQINKDLVPPSFFSLPRAAIVNPPQNSSDFLPPSFQFSLRCWTKRGPWHTFYLLQISMNVAQECCSECDGLCHSMISPNIWTHFNILITVVGSLWV